MFADTLLAARIDRAEARMCAQSAVHRPGGTGAHDSLVLPMSGGQAIYAGPGSPINKLIGLCLDTPLDLAALDEVERQWRERGQPVRIELSILTDPELGGVLNDRGYRLHGFENVLGRPLDRLHQRSLPASQSTRCRTPTTRGRGSTLRLTRS